MAESSDEHPEQKITNSTTNLHGNIYKSKIESALTSCAAEIMEAWNESLTTLSEKMATLTEENECIKQKMFLLSKENKELGDSCKSILKRLEVLEGRPNIPNSNSRSPEMGMVVLASPEPRDITKGPATSKYELIGTAENYLAFLEPHKSIDPATLALVHLEYVLIEGPQLIDFLTKCPNLKILRLIRLYFYEEMTGKVELNQLEEYHFCRGGRAGSTASFIDTLSKTIEALDSQIIFTKKGSSGNLFDLKARIELELAGTHTRILISDPKHGKLVSSLHCTTAILEEYMESELRYIKLKKVGLGFCDIRFENESVKAALRHVRELSLFRVFFYDNADALAQNDMVLCTLNRLEKLRYVPNGDSYSLTLSGVTVLPFPLKVLQTVQDAGMCWKKNLMSYKLDYVVLKCYQFRGQPYDIPLHAGTANTVHYIPALKIVSICSDTCLGQAVSYGGCGAHSLLHEVLIQKNPEVGRTKWIWIHNFPKPQKYLTNSLTRYVRETLIQHKAKTFTDFTLARQSSGNWVIHENTEEEIAELTAKYLPSWDKFVS